MTPTPARKSVHEAKIDLMIAIAYIAKNSRNAQQGFDFRGVDDVVFVVGPLLREHRVLCEPEELTEIQLERYNTTGGTMMTKAVVKVRWRWTGPDGSLSYTEMAGEAADAGDKAVTKAQSVSQRENFIKSLNIPVRQQDASSDSHVRIAGPITPARGQGGQRAAKNGNVQMPSGRDWLKEAVAIANAGLALVGTDIQAARAQNEVLIKLFREMEAFGELTPALNRKITEHGRALRDACAAAEQKAAETIRRESHNEQAAEAAAAVRASRARNPRR